MSDPSAPPPRIDETATMEVSASVDPTEVTATAGSTVSRYVVLEEVGRGAPELPSEASGRMGRRFRVMRAYDPKLQREVALKEVHAHLLDASATTRLVAEARAMAKLSHPNVVAVYDVEELPSASVVLVMEYVPGQTLRQWLSLSSPHQRERIDGQQQRPWREIVDSFVAAGRGLVAAHEAGLLHRDFKPANVLVPELPSTARGGSIDGPLVKVTDFGLAKADEVLASVSGGSEDSKGEMTEAGTVLGTPRYMAPEQHRGDELSAAADQYAFCVSLWEALCSDPPFAGKTMAEDKASGPPSWPTPSTPRPIADAIMRGLSPRPDDRWPTMAALLDALAYDPARRRNRWLLGLGGVGVLGLAGVSYGAWAEARAQRCSGAEQQLAGIWDPATSAEVQTAVLGIDKPYARDIWTRTQRELDGYASNWVAMHTEACEATTVRGEQSPQMMDLRMGCLHRAAQDLQATVETLADADDKVLHKAHKLTGGLRPLSRCADTEALATQVEPPLPAEADAVETARLELARAESLVLAGRYEAAQAPVEAAKDILAGVEYGPVRTEVALQEGLVLNELGQYEASETALSTALRLASQWRQPDAMAWAAIRLLFLIGHHQRRMEEGLRYWPLAEGLSRGRPKQEAAARNNLAVILYAQGKYGAAEAEHRAALSLKVKALGPDHPHVATSRNNLANALQAQGKYGAAEAEHRAALSLWEKALGPDHPDVARSRNNLAVALTEQGKYAEAEAEFRAALLLREKILGPDHPEVAMSRNNLAIALDEQGKMAEAEAEYLAARSLWEKALGPDHPNVAASRNNLAGVLKDQGKYAEAEAEFRAVLSLRGKALGPDHPEVAESRSNLSIALKDQGEYAEAEAEQRAALLLREKALGPDHPDVADSRSHLAGVLLKLGRTAEALPLAEQAWAHRQRDDIPPGLRGETAFVLAQILWAVEAPARDRSRARQLAEDALRSHRDAGDVYAEHAREVQQWLDTHRLR